MRNKNLKNSTKKCSYVKSSLFVILLTVILTIANNAACVSAISLAQIVNKRATPYWLPTLQQSWSQSSRENKSLQPHKKHKSRLKPTTPAFRRGYDIQAASPQLRKLYALKKVLGSSRKSIKAKIVKSNHAPKVLKSQSGRPPGGHQEGSQWSSEERARAGLRRLPVRPRRVRGHTVATGGRSVRPQGSSKPASSNHGGGGGGGKSGGGKLYNSYNKYKIGSYIKGSPQWQQAVIRYLFDMKKHGHKIRTINMEDKTLSELATELAPQKFMQKMPEQLRTRHHHQGSHSQQQPVNIPSTGAKEVAINSDPVVCKLEPYNICYRINRRTGERKDTGEVPVRLIRVY